MSGLNSENLVSYILELLAVLHLKIALLLMSDLIDRDSQDSVQQ